MSRRSKRELVAFVAVAALAGCTARPIPLAVQAGSTFVVPLSKDSEFYLLGYESEVTRAQGRFDDQRGEIVFVLVDDESTERELVTRWVTRAWPDPASPAGIANSLPEPIGVMSAQVVALVDVPAEIPSGDYTLQARVRRRTSADGSTPPEDMGGVFDVLLPPTELGTLRVLEGAGEPTPSTGLYANLVFDALPVMEDLVPYPRLLLGLGGTPYPAAGRIEISYPSNKIEILSAFEEGHLGRGSIVRWSDDRPNARVTIDFVDTDRSVYGIAVAFRLLDPFGAGRVALGDFVIVERRLYDSDGVPLSSPRGGLWGIL